MTMGAYITSKAFYDVFHAPDAPCFYCKQGPIWPQFQYCPYCGADLEPFMALVRAKKEEYLKNPQGAGWPYG